MKKILALVLALALTLTAVAALAAGSPEDPSGKVDPVIPNPAPAPANPNLVPPIPATNNNNNVNTNTNANGTGGTGWTNVADTGDTKDEAIALGKAEDTDGTRTIKNQVTEDKNSGNPLKSVNVELPAGYNQVNEMSTVKFPVGAKTFTFKKSFQTTYDIGEKVIVLIGIPGDPVEWIKAEGEVNENGEVEFTLSKADYNKIAGKEVVMMPVSKEK